jgi:sterol desaturase/sphingolipid hydroxylase (fatty acid hydroxylase superfamily)
VSPSHPSESGSALVRVASIALFLALVAGLPAAAVALRRAGAQQDGVALLVLVCAGVALAVLERLAPYAPAWNRARGDVRLDGLHTAVSIVVGAVVPAVVTGTLVRLGADGRGSVLWPGTWPLAAQVLVALALADLGKYALHRWSHESAGFLWRVHAVHHDAERLYWLNAGRFHPLNVAFNVTLAVLPLRPSACPRRSSTRHRS